MDDDPRAMLAYVLDLVGGLAESLSEADLLVEAPFPGATLGDVRAELLRILTRLIEAVGDIPNVAVEDGWSQQWQRLRRQLSTAAEPPEVLDRAVATRSGPRPARTVLLSQIPVLVLLAWDLVMATDRTDDLDEDLIRFALAVALHAVPAQGRRQMPFLGPVRAVAGDASDGMRLAAWLGHRVA